MLSDARKPGHPEEWDYFIDKESKIAYVRLVNFSETSADELKKTLGKLQEEGMRV